MTTDVRQLEDMREAAYGLGMAFAQAAEAEGDLDRKLRLFDAFHRSFASVRLSIALAMRLRREALLPARTGPAGAERGTGSETEVERCDAAEPPDHVERPERFDERDRDRETASLPILLRTLEHVADDARDLLPKAAELPTLRELLDRVRAGAAASAPGAPAAPGGPRNTSRNTPQNTPLRARLSGGAATLTLAPPPQARPPGPDRRVATHRPATPLTADGPAVAGAGSRPGSRT